MWLLIRMLALLCLASRSALSTEEALADVVKDKIPYDKGFEIVFDEQQPIRNSSLVYAACLIDHFRQEMDCTVVLRSFPGAKKIHESSCHSHYKPPSSRQIGLDFQLKRLVDDRVAFVWTDDEKLLSDGSKPHLVLSVINMDDCQHAEYNFEAAIKDFHVVSYAQTFDVYYHDKDRCGDFMCGESFDSDGKVLNGPATSYLPGEYFTDQTHVCSVRSNSSALGHYVITPSFFHLVTADWGKRYQMGILPVNFENNTYACDENFLGYCWQTNNNENRRSIINCQQFNSRGRQILSTGEGLDFHAGSWLAMRNLGPSQLLLLISRCDDESTCAGNTKDMTFYVLQMNPNGNTDELHTFRGLECDNAKIVKSEVIRNEDGQICATVACHVENEDRSHSVNLLSTCVRK